MSENRSRNWLKISCIGCVGCPCLVLLITFGWVKMQISKIGNRLPADLAKLRTMGVPTEPADLAPSPARGPGQNAEALYEELIADMKRYREDNANKEYFRAVSRAGSARPNATDEALVSEGVAKLDGVLRKADKLAAIPHLYFHRDYSLGAMVVFPEYSDIKDLARWQAARARLYVKQGNAEGSLKALASIFAMARHCTEEPTIIGALVGVAIDTIGHATLGIHLEAFKNDQAVLAATRKLLEAIPHKFDLKRSLSGELVMGRTAIQKLRNWHELNWVGDGTEEAPQNDPIDRLTLQDPSVRAMFEAKYVELWRKTHEKMPQDGTDWKGVQEAMSTVDQSLQKDQSLENTLNQIMFPVFEQFALAGGMFQARHQLSLLAVRLLQDRPKGLPKNLSRYGSLAIDPMDGKPIRYSLKNGGFKIWSVGQDLVDNGGVKFYPGTGMAYQNVDEVRMFFYPERPPSQTTPPGSRGGIPGGPPPGFGGPNPEGR